MKIALPPKDALQLSYWLSSRATLQEVLEANRIGLVGNERFTEKARRVYVLIWEWSAHRFGGAIGARQEALYKRHGRAFLEARFKRVNNIARRLAGRVENTTY